MSKPQFDVAVLDASDTVGTALRTLAEGETVELSVGGSLLVAEAIPLCHKVALAPISAGEIVQKYGSAIGVASSDIEKGFHVHVHNLASRRG